MNPPAMASHDLLRLATISARTRAERVRLLFSISGGIATASLVAAGLVLGRLWPQPNAFLLAAWGALMVALAFASAGLVDRYRAAAPAASRAGVWERRLGWASAFNGAAWAGLHLVTLPPQPGEEQLFILLALGAISLAAAGALTPSRIAFYGFVIPAGLVLAFSLGLSGPLAIERGGWAMMGFLMALVAIHELFHRSLVATLGKRFESDALAQEQQIIFDTASEAIAFIRDDRVVKCNRRFGELMGAPIERLVGQPVRGWFPSEDAWRAAARAAQDAIDAGGIHRATLELRRQDGTRFRCELGGSAVDPSRPELGTVWLGRDITAQLATEAALRSSEGRFRDLLSLSSDWYWEQDREFRFVRTSGGVSQRIGLPQDLVLGRRRWEIEFFKGVTAEQWQAHRQTLERHEPFRDFVYRFEPPGAEPRWLSISGKPIFDEAGRFAGYHGVGSDITERVRSAEQLRHLAHHDVLTGLPNRRLFVDRMEQAIARARRSGVRVGLMLLDLDEFKAINDSQGHSVGDQVLIGVAQRLKNGLRESDTVARLGGDEFVILLADTGQLRDVARIAAKAIESVCEPLPVGTGRYRIGASVGIALFPDHADSAERLMQEADIAMYEAKRAGGSNYRFSSAGLAAGHEQLPLIVETQTLH
jgi:diguanylate cyclase (GGDEF)-like protein/PAS domain S-box-containing protein